jgi:heme/copper-type cytochrome/quinol oxidase subunit 2
MAVFQYRACRCFAQKNQPKNKNHQHIFWVNWQRQLHQNPHLAPKNNVSLLLFVVIVVAVAVVVLVPCILYLFFILNRVTKKDFYTPHFKHLNKI